VAMRRHVALWRLALAHVGLCILLKLEEVGKASAATVDGAPAEDEPIPDKVGAEVRLSKAERSTLKSLECSMCKAILREMHMEVVKHRMTQKGWGSESQVIETSNAMCLGLLQKYRLDLDSRRLEQKPEDEEDDMDMFAGAGPGGVEKITRGMLVLKMGCQRWLEDYGGDTSGHVFKAVKDSADPDDSSKEYCSKVANLCGPGRTERRRQEKEQGQQREQKRRELRKEEDKREAKIMDESPFSKLPEDSKMGLQRMLEMAKDDPLHYMDEEARRRIQQGRPEIRCDVCHVVLEDVRTQVVKRPKSMQNEYDILPLVEGACEGGKDLSVPNYFGVEAPPLPPAWTDRYRPKLDKKLKRWRLVSFPKKAAKKRTEWRALTPTGKQKPPPPDQHEGDLMMTLTCKDTLEAARMAEVLYEEMSVCGARGVAQGCDAALSAARKICKTDKDVACEYEPLEEGKKEDL